jgi:hypothetical protein
MSVYNWIFIIAIILLAAIYIVTIIVKIVNYIKNKSTKNESVDLKDVWQIVVNGALAFVEDAENVFNTISNGKAGPLKLDRVLSKIKELCLDEGVAYDKEYWTNFVESVVKIMNINKNPIQSNGQSVIYEKNEENLEDLNNAG